MDGVVVGVVVAGVLVAGVPTAGVPSAERIGVPCGGVFGLTTLGGNAELGRAAANDDEDVATGGALGARFFVIAGVASGFDVVAEGVIGVRVLLLSGIARGTGCDGSRRTGTGAADGTALFAAGALAVAVGDDGDAAAVTADEGAAGALGSS
ncbi:MAG TPA: hypothetical protein VFV99_31950 [Kofleriaceae bacterium]|nr:hypothetical protein [Kofleriaceae bacterium]